MKLFLLEMKNDEIFLIARAENKKGLVGDATFSVKKDSFLFGLSFEEIKEQIEQAGMVVIPS